MSIRVPGQRSLRWRLGGMRFTFEGGLNLRDAATEIAPNELSQATNFTLDERGVLSKRNNHAASASFPAPPGQGTAFFYSNALGLGILQVGTTIYKCALGGGSWTSFRTTGSSAPVAITDFGAGIAYVHPVDGVRYYDGTTDTSASTTVKGNTIKIWQNKAWVGSATSARVWFSDVGAITFTNPDFIDIKEKDSKPITALWPGSGLLVFKDDSFYRIGDSSTGSYQTIDWQAGCVGARAITASDGRIYFWGLDGLYTTNGLSPGVNIGDKVRPYYSGINAAGKATITAAPYNGRIYFNFPSTPNDATIDAILELNPRVGWIMLNFFTSNNIGPFASYLNSSGANVVSFPNLALPSTNTMKDLYTSTTRTGYACSMSTGYQEPFGGMLGRVYRMAPQVDPPVSTSLAFTLNWIDVSGASQSVTLTENFANTPVQRPSLFPQKAGRSFSVTIDDSASPLTAVYVYDVALDALLIALQ